MRRSGTRSRRRAEALLALVLLGASACVTRGSYQEVVGERARLRAEVQRLQQRLEQLGTTNESLGEERLKLLDEMEDLRQARGQLERDVRRLERAGAELSENLRARERELARRSEELARLRVTYQELVGDLEAEVAAGQIQIEQLREGLRLNLTQGVLFASGSAQVGFRGKAVLRKVAKRLKGLPHRIEVQGHTDDVPVRRAAAFRFPSNWELAAARATEVVRLLEKGGIDPRRLTAVSYGQHAPVASNGTPEGRAKNRRIEIRLHPVVEPPAAAAARGEAAAP